MSLRIGLLGPLHVYDDDRALALAAGKQRVVLAALALGANRVVSLDELAEAVWDGQPPAAAEMTLRNYIRRLRQALGPVAAGALETRRGGYRLAMAEQQLDVTRFEHLCRRAHSLGETDRAGARALLLDALALWRGAPLAAFESSVRREGWTPRLDQLRIQALEQLNEADLDAGRYEQLIPALWD